MLKMFTTKNVPGTPDRRVNLIWVAAITLLAVTMITPTLAAETEEEEKIEGPLAFTMDDIEGEAVELKQYKGQIVMLVNVASECGLTPQYEELQALYDEYKDQGFIILGFPANNFMGQEPGTNEEIKFFCQTEYNVNFDMFSKISVKGDDINPLYKYLTEEESNEDFAGEIEWNFAKFLLNHEGEVIDRFDPRTTPKDDTVVAAIEAALEAKEAAEEA